MKKILVIDDSKTVRPLCEWIYKGLDDKLFTAASAAEGEKIIQAESPDVVFVDYTLPDGNAIDFIKSHKSNQRAMILLGGTYVDCDVDAAMAAGAFDCLIKPFKTDDYFGLVDNAYASLSGESAAKAEPATPPAQPSSVSSPVIPRSNSGLASVPRTSSGISVPPIPGAPKRFNFPSQQSAPAIPRVNEPQSVDAAAVDSHASCTPKTPVPSVTPEIASLASAVISSTTFHDELKNAIQEELTDFISEAIAAEFKKGINSEVNAYFTNSIMPQLQKWIDARVVAIVRKMTGK